MPSPNQSQVKQINSHVDKRLPLVIILGPTAVGKTNISIQLAERLGGEIVSADSRLFYRGMDIGTAKPTMEERTRVPHHLIDLSEPDQVWSLATFQERAQQAIMDIHKRGRLPFLVGGTGQYLRAVAEGWAVPEVEPDPRLRAALERWADEIGPGDLHARLERLDPEAAARIDYRNLRRTVRALEVIFSSGERFSSLRRSGQSPFRLLQIGLIRSREELYKRIDARIETMLEAGFVDEVQKLLRQGYSPELPSLSAIGYREIIGYLQGEYSLDEAITVIQRATRTYVRRQANWFKTDDPDIQWFNLGSDTLNDLESVIRNWLIEVSV